MKQGGSVFCHILLAGLAAFVVASSSMAAAMEEKPKDFDAHEAYSPLHFKDSEMDFAFALILGAAVNGGCEVGEAFYVANAIREGDAASWQEQWLDMAGRVEARGGKSLAAGRKVSALNQWRRASYYYRAALISMMPDDPRFKETALKSRELLKKAGALMDPPLEYVAIPFEGTALPGYFRKGGPGADKRKTLIMLGGGETFAEDLVFYIAPEAHARGYNFLTADLPGQGLLPLEGKVFRPDMDVPIRAVTDYALSRPETDPEKLVAYGISGGGGFVPMAAQRDSRLKAIAMNSAVVDAERLFAAMPVASATKDVVAGWPSFKQNTVKAIAWRWGVSGDDIPGLVAANRGFVFDPAKVRCPALLLVGEGEYSSEEVRRQQKECLDNLSNPRKRLVVTPADEGASNHCITENRGLMSQEVFDFFDEVLPGS